MQGSREESGDEDGRGRYELRFEAPAEENVDAGNQSRNQQRAGERMRKRPVRGQKSSWTEKGAQMVEIREGAGEDDRGSSESRSARKARARKRIGRQTMCDRVHDAKVIRLVRSEEHTSELQSRLHLVCRLLLEK